MPVIDFSQQYFPACDIINDIVIQIHVFHYWLIIWLSLPPSLKDPNNTHPNSSTLQ